MLVSLYNVYACCIMQIELISIIKINYLIGEDISHLFYVITVKNTTQYKLTLYNITLI